MSSGFWELWARNVGLCPKTTFHFSDEEVLKQPIRKSKKMAFFCFLQPLSINRFVGFELATSLFITWAAFNKRVM